MFEVALRGVFAGGGVIPLKGEKINTPSLENKTRNIIQYE